MQRTISYVTLAFSLVLGTLLYACSTETVDGEVCSPGETRSCVGPGACEGGQQCESDGAAWGECDCGGMGASSGASTGASMLSACDQLRLVAEQCDPRESRPNE